MHQMMKFQQRQDRMEAPVLGAVAGALIGGGGTLAGMLSVGGLIGAGIGAIGGSLLGGMMEQPRMPSLSVAPTQQAPQTPATPATPAAPAAPQTPAATPTPAVTPPVNQPAQPVAEPTPTPEDVAVPGGQQAEGPAPLTAEEIAQGQAATKRRRGRMSTILTKPSQRGIPEDGEQEVERLGG